MRGNLITKLLDAIQEYNSYIYNEEYEYAKVENQRIEDLRDTLLTLDCACNLYRNEDTISQVTITDIENGTCEIFKF